MFTIYSASYLISRNEWNYGATILVEECVSNAVYIDSFNINAKANPTNKTNSCEIVFQHIMNNEVMDLAVRNSEFPEDTQKNREKTIEREKNGKTKHKKTHILLLKI